MLSNSLGMNDQVGNLGGGVVVVCVNVCVWGGGGGGGIVWVSRISGGGVGCYSLL